MWTKVIQVKKTKTKMKTRTITSHAFPEVNLTIHKELKHSNRIITETPAELNPINVYIWTKINIFLNSLSFCLTKRTLLFHPL